MEQILTRGRKVRDSFSELILQPQSDIPHFRRYLAEEGYSIAGKYRAGRRQVLSDDESSEDRNAGDNSNTHGGRGSFGKFLLKQRHPVLKQYLEREKRIREQILVSLGEAKGIRLHSGSWK